MDADGLWVCEDCESRMTTSHVGDSEGEELDESLKPLVGQNSGAICRTLELPYEPPFQSVIDAASKIGYDEDRYLSTWSFQNQWLDGTTVWLSEDRTTKALVHPNGEVQINEI